MSSNAGRRRHPPHPALVGWLRGLDRRERTIVMLRYLSGPAWTLEAVGRELDLTRERVRQLEGRMLDRGAEMVMSAKFAELAEALELVLPDHPSGGDSATANARARETT